MVEEPIRKPKIPPCLIWIQKLGLVLVRDFWRILGHS
jgi:hypothetical protein